MFTDKGLEETKEKKITTGKSITMQEGLGKLRSLDWNRMKTYTSCGLFVWGRKI